MSKKTIQRKLWSVARQYWAQHFEPWFLPMYKKVLEQLELTEDHLLLDGACGSGLFSYLAIEAEAEFIGLDSAAGLLHAARQPNPQNNFLEEDLEALPVADNSFQVVAAFNLYQHAGNFDDALREAIRVLRPSGRLVITFGDNAEMSDAANVLKSIGALSPRPPPGTPGPFALSN